MSDMKLVVICLATVAAFWPFIFLASKVAREFTRRGPVRLTITRPDGVVSTVKIDPNSVESIDAFLEKVNTTQRRSGKDFTDESPPTPQLCESQG